MKHAISLVLAALALCAATAATAAPPLKENPVNLAKITEPCHNAQVCEQTLAGVAAAPLWHELSGSARMEPMARAERILTTRPTQDQLRAALPGTASTVGNGAFQSVAASLVGYYEPDTSGASITDLAEASVSG